MLTRMSLSVRKTLFTQFRRNLGVSAVVTQKAAAQLDPIQNLFVTKIREYAQKSKSAGGGAVECSPEDTKRLENDLAKIKAVFGAEGPDFLKYPTFSFTDPDLERVGVDATIKDVEIDEAAAEVKPLRDPDVPFWVL